MSPNYWLWPFLFVCNVSSLVVSLPQLVDSGGLIKPVPSTRPASATIENELSGNTNVTVSSNEAPHCDGAVYGRPYLPSCRWASSLIPDVPVVLTFAKRPAGSSEESEQISNPLFPSFPTK